MVGRMSSINSIQSSWRLSELVTSQSKNVGLPYQKHRFIHPSHGRRILGRSWIMSSKWSPKGFQKTSMMSSWEISTCQPGRLLIFLVNLLDLPGSLRQVYLFASSEVISPKTSLCQLPRLPSFGISIWGFLLVFWRKILSKTFSHESCQ